MVEKKTQEKELFSEYRDPMTAEEVAKALSISKRTVYRLVENDELPAVKVGHRFYFPRSAMVERFCVEA